MDHYGLVNKGPFYHQILPTLPVWTAADEGREIYVQATRQYYRGTNVWWEIAAAFPSGTKMLFYQNTAPIGWTIDTTLDDKLVYITKGSVAGGQTGGAAHTTGTWTQPGHTHTGSSHTHTGPSHNHSYSQLPYHNHSSGVTVYGGGPYGSGYLPYGGASAAVPTSYAGISVCYTANGGTGVTGAGGTGTTGLGATSSTWRPASYCCIICSKN